MAIPDTHPVTSLDVWCWRRYRIEMGGRFRDCCSVDCRFSSYDYTRIAVRTAVSKQRLQCLRYYACLIRVSLGSPSPVVAPEPLQPYGAIKRCPNQHRCRNTIDSLSGLCHCLLCGIQLLKKACNHVRKMGGTRVRLRTCACPTRHCARPDGASDSRVTAD